jgi:uncharacterized protein (DUF1330 family)
MLKNALLVTASILVGAGGVQLLHAAGMAPVYSVAVIDIKDADSYKKEVGDVRKRISDMGGKYLVAAGVGSSNEVMVQLPEGGKVPSRLVITEWSNIDAYKKWWTEAGEKDTKMLAQHANSFYLYAAEGVTK